MVAPYLLERWVWTDADFARMGWHDAHIHGLAFLAESHEFALDIDYLFAWVQPAAGETSFSFWVAPCTLVFADMYGVELAFSPSYDGAYSLNALTRELLPPPPDAAPDAPPYWRWQLDGHEGSITFEASGFTQYVRAAPQHVREQRLDLAARGGVSFARGRA